MFCVPFLPLKNQQSEFINLQSNLYEVHAPARRAHAPLQRVSTPTKDIARRRHHSLVSRFFSHDGWGRF